MKLHFFAPGFIQGFKDGGCKVGPRFHLFVSDGNQGNEEAV